MMRTQFAKYRGRGTRDFSTTSHSSVSAIVKRRWENQKASGLWIPFIAGYCGYVYINFQKRKEIWYRVERMHNEEVKRAELLSEKFWRYLGGDYDDPPASTTPRQ